VYPKFDVEAYRRGELSPVFFGSAVNNFGVKELLDCFVDIAPMPSPRQTEEREIGPLEDKFTGFVFKIHANIDPKHRDRIAFVRVCSGTFERNTNYLHVRHGKQMKFSNPTSFMASKKEVIDDAYPGDIVGLYDSGNFKIGDALTSGEKLHFKGIPRFSPEMFRYVQNTDPMKTKQLTKGLDQLMDEGVAQMFVREFNGRTIIGTVGALQFEVIQHRLLHEYSASCIFEPVSLSKALWVYCEDKAELANFKERRKRDIAYDKYGQLVFLAETPWSISMVQENHPKVRLSEVSEE
jgi:peptide chain release factor 3